MVELNGSGWHGLSVTGNQDLSFSEAKMVWGVADATINSVYEVSSEPVSNGGTPEWSRIKDDATLSPYKGYWVNIELNKWVEQFELHGTESQLGRPVELSADGTVIAIGNPTSGINEVVVYETSDGGTTWTQKGNTITGDDLVNNDSFSINNDEVDTFGETIGINEDGSILAVADPLKGFAVVYKYSSSNDEWTLISDIIYVQNADGQMLQGDYTVDSDGTHDGTWYTLKHIRMNASGDRLILGNVHSYYDGSSKTNHGTVNVYEYDGSGTAWSLLGDPIIGEADNTGLGISVSMNSAGDIIAIGGYAWDTDTNGNVTTNIGHTKIYRYGESDGWSQIGESIVGEAENDQSGRNVRLNADGDIVAIGAYKNDDNGSNSGHVRVYQCDNVSNGSSATWTQLGQDLDGIAYDDQQGTIALNSTGDRLIVGTDIEGSSTEKRGYVRTYAYSSTHDTWYQSYDTIYGNDDQSDNFGMYVSMNEDATLIAVGAPWYNDKDGYAKIYKLESY